MKNKVIKPLMIDESNLFVELDNPECDDAVLVSIDGNLLYLDSDATTLIEAMSFVFLQKKVFVYNSRKLEYSKNFFYKKIRDINGRVKKVSEPEFEKLILSRSVRPTMEDLRVS